MLIHCKGDEAKVLVDRGTNCRIPFAIWYDPATGDYEHFKLASNGVDMAADDDWNPIRVRGKAIGALVLVPLGDSHQFGYREPVKIKEKALPKLSLEQRHAGLDQYRKVYTQVWQFRGESRRAVDERWEQYLKENVFFDSLMLRRRLIKTS